MVWFSVIMLGHRYSCDQNCVDDTARSDLSFSHLHGINKATRYTGWPVDHLLSDLLTIFLTCWWSSFSPVDHFSYLLTIFLPVVHLLTCCSSSFWSVDHLLSDLLTILWHVDHVLSDVLTIFFLTYWPSSFWSADHLLSDKHHKTIGSQLAVPVFIKLLFASCWSSVKSGQIPVLSLRLICITVLCCYSSYQLTSTHSSFLMVNSLSIFLSLPWPLHSASGCVLMESIGSVEFSACN